MAGGCGKEHAFVTTKRFKTSFFPTQSLFYKAKHATCSLGIANGVIGIGGSKPVIASAHGHLNIFRNARGIEDANVVKHFCFPEGCAGTAIDILRPKQRM